MRHPVDLHARQIDAARPRAVKLRTVARDLSGGEEVRQRTPALVVALVARDAPRVGKAQREPVDGIEQIGDLVAVVRQQGGLRAGGAAAVGLVARVVLAIRAGGMPELLQTRIAVSR